MAWRVCWEYAPTRMVVCTFVRPGRRILVPRSEAYPGMACGTEVAYGGTRSCSEDTARRCKRSAGLVL
eukprot:1222165-Rhodomonas_salina.1